MKPGKWCCIEPRVCGAAQRGDAGGRRSAACWRGEGQARVGRVLLAAGRVDACCFARVHPTPARCLAPGCRSPVSLILWLHHRLPRRAGSRRAPWRHVGRLRWLMREHPGQREAGRAGLRGESCVGQPTLTALLGLSSRERAQKSIGSTITPQEMPPCAQRALTTAACEAARRCPPEPAVAYLSRLDCQSGLRLTVSIHAHVQRHHHVLHWPSVFGFGRVGVCCSHPAVRCGCGEGGAVPWARRHCPNGLLGCCSRLHRHTATAPHLESCTEQQSRCFNSCGMGPSPPPHVTVATRVTVSCHHHPEWHGAPLLKPRSSNNCQLSKPSASSPRLLRRFLSFQRALAMEVRCRPSLGRCLDCKGSRCRAGTVPKASGGTYSPSGAQGSPTWA